MAGAFPHPESTSPNEASQFPKLSELILALPQAATAISDSLLYTEDTLITFYALSSHVPIIDLGGIIILGFQRLREVKELAQLLTSRGYLKPAPSPSKAHAQFMVLLGLLALTWKGQLPAGTAVA